MPFVKQNFNIKEPIKATLFLRNTFNISIKESQKIIDKGRIKKDGKAFLQKSGVLHGNVEISTFVASDIKVEPMFRTSDFALFDKPSKMLIHPKGNFHHISLLDAIRFHFGVNANPVHRLDKETSGLVLVGLNKKSETQLKIMFQEQKITKEYIACVMGRINNCIIDANILEQDKSMNLGIKSLIHNKGKKSITKIEVIKHNKSTTLIKAYPLTGRTHQIRIHLSHIGHRILGDYLYGVKENLSKDYLDGKIRESERKKYFGSSRLMLHASALSFNFDNTTYYIKSHSNELEKYLNLML